MAETNSTFEDIILRGLQGNLQDQVFQKLVADRMKTLQEEIEKITRNEVERYTIQSIDKFRNHFQITEEVKVLFYYKEKH